MAEKGWYPMQTAPEQELNTVKQKYAGKQVQMDKSENGTVLNSKFKFGIQDRPIFRFIQIIVKKVL